MKSWTHAKTNSTWVPHYYWIWAVTEGKDFINLPGCAVGVFTNLWKLKSRENPSKLYWLRPKRQEGSVVALDHLIAPLQGKKDQIIFWSNSQMSVATVVIQATLLNPDMCNLDFCLNQRDWKVPESLPIHIIPIRIIQILPNPDRNLESTSVRIKQSCLYNHFLLLLSKLSDLLCKSQSKQTMTKFMGTSMKQILLPKYMNKLGIADRHSEKTVPKNITSHVL